MKGEIFPVVNAITQNCFTLTEIRTPRLSVPDKNSTDFYYRYSKSQRQLESAINLIAAGKKVDELSRRQGRRLRRYYKRKAQLEKRNQKITLTNIYAFDNLYNAGKKSCNGVRWKQSTQNFELHLLSKTASSLNNIINNTYKPAKYKEFYLNERGKTRLIQAPKIDDRQIGKLYTNEVLLPLYQPQMIKNNGASLKDKGLSFTFEQLKKELRRHYKKYGLAGGVIITDGKQYFPNALHSRILEFHNQNISDKQLRELGNKILQLQPSKKGLPLGVEPSQAEMIYYPTALDNYMKCQVGIKSYIHYMDDFLLIIPPNIDYKIILKILQDKAQQYGIYFNVNKTHYIPLARSFTFCKARFKFTSTGKIIMRANKTTMRRNKHKLKTLYKKIRNLQITYSDLWASVNGMIAYLRRFNEHKNLLQLYRFFYLLFHFSCEKFIYLQKKLQQQNRRRIYEIYNIKTL